MDTFGTSHFVHCRDVVLFWRLFCIECICNGTFLCTEVCPLSECLLSEIPLYIYKLTFPPQHMGPMLFLLTITKTKNIF